MKKKLILFCCLFYLSSLFVYCSKAEVSIKNTFKIMSFNIRYGTANDGVNAWSNRNDFLFEVIKNYNPDILGVQEALNFQLEELSLQFPHFKKSGVGRDNGVISGEHSTIFYDSTKYTLLQQETFWFSETPEKPGSIAWGSKFPRICSWVSLRDKESYTTFFIFNNHWDHESQQSRDSSARMLLDKISELDINDYPIIILGDFNAGEDNPAFKKLTENQTIKFTDSFRSIHPLATDVGTYNNFTGITSGAKIDAILISSAFVTVKAEILRTNRNGIYPSDHFPVTAEVILTNKSIKD